MVRGTSLGWSTAATVALRGRPWRSCSATRCHARVLRPGLPFRGRCGMALAADTVSIAVMELARQRRDESPVPGA
jgi:hypothetical protein